MSKITYIPNRVIDADGISDGASIYVYQAGSSTLVDLFEDSDYETPTTNPIVVPAGAAVPVFFTDYTGSIRVRVVASDGSVPMDEDPYEPFQDAVLRVDYDDFRVNFGQIVNSEDTATEAANKIFDAGTDSEPLLVEGVVSCNSVTTPDVIASNFGAIGAGARLNKAENGAQWTHAGSYGKFSNLTLDGTGFTGDGLVLSNVQGNTDLHNVNVQAAEGVALKASGPVHVFGGVYYTTNADTGEPDIRIGTSGTATLYSSLVGVRTSQADHGIYEIDTGSSFRMGIQCGNITIDQSDTPPDGINGGYLGGSRINGNATFNQSNTAISANTFNGDVLIGEDTSNVNIGPENIVRPERKIDQLGNNAANYVCVNRGNGTDALGGMRLCYGASGTGALGAGAEWWATLAVDGDGEPDISNAGFGTPGGVFAGYQRGFRLLDSTNTRITVANLYSSNALQFGNITVDYNVVSAKLAIQQLINATVVTYTEASAFRPGTDNTFTLGTGTYRWSQLYAGTATINTSDERLKQDIEDLSAAELAVATACKGLVKKFRFKDAVTEKGDAARTHIGLIAQEVIAAFEAENLDPFSYGIVCKDEWEAEEPRTEVIPGTPATLDVNGEIVEPEVPDQIIEHPGVEAGWRYGLRYEELICFIMAAL